MHNVNETNILLTDKEEYILYNSIYLMFQKDKTKSIGLWLLLGNTD
jgi:hypothetical protein